MYVSSCIYFLYFCLIFTLLYENLVSMAEYDQVKKLRATAKAKVTRSVNKINQLIAEDELSKLEEGIKNLKVNFSEFTKFHDELLTFEQVDEDYDEYYTKVQSLYIDSLTKAKILVTRKESVSVKENDTHNLNALFTLPKVELKSFSGNPLDYHAFIRSFMVNVDKVCDDADSKLTRLLSYVEGPAYEAIKGHQIVGGKIGYESALAKLRELYGDKFRITESIIKGLRSSRKVHSPRDIQAFGFELVNARDILKDINMLHEVDTQVVIFDIVSRLPFFVQNRWSKEELKHKRAKGGYLKFVDFVGFVNDIAEEMLDPVCGSVVRQERRSRGQTVTSHASSVPSRGRGKKNPRNSGNSSKIISHDSGVNQNKAKNPQREFEILCKLCKGDHNLSRCPDFKALKVPERLDFVKKHNVCENCLKYSHTVESCLSLNRCFVCQSKHSAYLHIDQCKTNLIGCQNPCFMPIVSVLVNGRIWVKAALDTCSSHTFCSSELVRKLNIESTMSAFSLKTLAGTSSVRSQLVSFSITAEDQSLMLSGVKVIDTIPVSAANIDVSSYSHLSGLDLSHNIGCDEVDILIGQDFADALFPLETRSGKEGEPFAVRYKFGWTLNGSVRKVAVSEVVICNFVYQNSSSEIRNLYSQQNHAKSLDSTLEIEEVDIFSDRKSMSIVDRKVVELWDNECRLDEGHYVLPIPWKNPREMCENNFVAVKHRFNNLVQRLHKLGIYEKYDDEISKLLSENYAEVVPHELIEKSRGVNYIPHHCVFNPNKPDKLRVVFDCASKFFGSSLNDRVHRGPDLLNNLLHVLLRFRLHQYAFQADVTAMYNQVRVPIYDRDALRFLWMKNDQLLHLRMSTHLFGGVWCASASTYALLRTVKDNPDVDSLTRNAVLDSTYVDDCLVSVRKRSQVKDLITKLPEVLDKGGFLLTKFIVNDRDLMSRIPVDKWAKEVYEFSEKSVGKALGVQWHIADDKFIFLSRKIDSVSTVTRRSMLSFVSSIFDPLGLISYLLLAGKLLLQEAVRLKLDWDVSVPESLSDKWKTWLSSDEEVHSSLWHNLKDVSFPRCIKSEQFDDGYLEYHVFSDSSQLSFGCCIYLRCISSSGLISCELITSKSHVCSLKQLTIPRLELQAACKASQLFDVVRRELKLPVAPVFFWTDSKIVIGYIRNETRRFHTFVQNRVSVIRSLSSVDSWRYVESRQNPADLTTKVKSQYTDADHKFWRHGPSWLLEYSAFWHIPDVQSVEISENDPEIKSLVSQTISSWLQRVSDHYSSWTKMIRAVAWIRRWVLSFKMKQKINHGLELDELISAERLLVKDVQIQFYSSEMKDLSVGHFVSKSSSLRSLTPFLDEFGILRVGGRIDNHPMIIPNAHSVAKALVIHYHSISHSGWEWTLGLIREKFWICRARPLVRRLLHSCVSCRKLKGKPIHQFMADLPKDRITPCVPCFTFTGLDAFGPYLIKNDRATRKRYGCLFTCMTTRAVHLEVLYSLDSESFINAFRRFIARRGMVKCIYSDQGRNFVKGEDDLRKAFLNFSASTLREYGVSRGIDWKFNVPHSPHMGGAWERMVKTVKSVLKFVIRDAPRLNDEIFSTLLCEVENITNGRPLTKLSDDPNDFTPLTPNHFLLLKQGCCLPPCKGSVADAFRRRWRYVQHLSDQFWRRWIKLYLPQLQSRTKWDRDPGNCKVGELVLLMELNVPRNLWPLAIIDEVFYGRDGKVRSVIVRTKTTKLHRPVVKLVRLEVNS